MRKIYLDTNVLLDFLLGREGSKKAATILQLGKSKAIHLYCSIVSIADIFYVLRKHIGKAEALEGVSMLMKCVNILPMGDMTVYSVLQDCGPDFEDSLQMVCAQTALCDYLITRNPKDYTQSSLPILSPADFLNLCNHN